MTSITLIGLTVKHLRLASWNGVAISLFVGSSRNLDVRNAQPRTIGPIE